MAKPVLTAPHFHNEEAAFEYVEAHLWPDGPHCPHCGNVDDKRIGRLTGKSSRPGLRKCYACRKTFTVRIGSIFEDSHFPLHLWLQAIQLINASKKGISTRQIQRTFNCSMKTAWFLTHRIREIMQPAIECFPIGWRRQDPGSRSYLRRPQARNQSAARRQPHESGFLAGRARRQRSVLPHAERPWRELARSSRSARLAQEPFYDR